MVRLMIQYKSSKRTIPSVSHHDSKTQNFRIRIIKNILASSDGNDGAPQKESKTGKTISKLRISSDINYLKDTTSPTTPTKSESIDDYQTILSPQENDKDAVNVFEVLGGSQKDFEKVSKCFEEFT